MHVIMTKSQDVVRGLQKISSKSIQGEDQKFQGKDGI